MRLAKVAVAGFRALQLLSGRYSPALVGRKVGNEFPAEPELSEWMEQGIVSKLYPQRPPVDWNQAEAWRQARTMWLRLMTTAAHEIHGLADADLLRAPFVLWGAPWQRIGRRLLRRPRQRDLAEMAHWRELGLRLVLSSEGDSSVLDTVREALLMPGASWDALTLGYQWRYQEWSSARAGDVKGSAAPALTSR
jgi:hypothetical protein